MCPVCVANMTLIAVGATSSGGLTAFTMNKFYKKQRNQTKGEKNETSGKENQSPRNRIGS